MHFYCNVEDYECIFIKSRLIIFPAGLQWYIGADASIAPPQCWHALLVIRHISVLTLGTAAGLIMIYYFTVHYLIFIWSKVVELIITAGVGVEPYLTSRGNTCFKFMVIYYNQLTKLNRDLKIIEN